MTDETPPRSKRGFASMDPKRRSQISRLGGKAVPSHKRAFNDRRLAMEAGRLGGKAVPPEKRAYSVDRQLAVEAGRKGGTAVLDEKRSFSTKRALASLAGRQAAKNRRNTVILLPEETDLPPVA